MIGMSPAYPKTEGLAATLDAHGRLLVVRLAGDRVELVDGETVHAPLVVVEGHEDLTGPDGRGDTDGDAVHPPAPRTRTSVTTTQRTARPARRTPARREGRGRSRSWRSRAGRPPCARATRAVRNSCTCRPSRPTPRRAARHRPARSSPSRSRP